MEAKRIAKPRNAKATQANILAAARKVFSEVSYSRAGLRDIAALADVHAKVLQWHFGAKSDLYEAALTDAMKYNYLPGLKREDVGQFITNGLVKFSPESSAIKMISLASGDPDASAIVLKVAGGPKGISALAGWLGPPNAMARAMKITILIHGFLTYHTNIPLLRQSPEVLDDIKNWLEQGINEIVGCE